MVQTRLVEGELCPVCSPPPLSSPSSEPGDRQGHPDGLPESLLPRHQGGEVYDAPWPSQVWSAQVSGRTGAGGEELGTYCGPREGKQQDRGPRPDVPSPAFNLSKCRGPQGDRPVLPSTAASVGVGPRGPLSSGLGRRGQERQYAEISWPNDSPDLNGIVVRPKIRLWA